MSVLVHKGQTGVDFSFARPPAARLVELGYDFVVGYISVLPAAPAKNITQAQCEEYLAAGLKVLLVWEMNAARANLGSSYGTADGANARTAAANLGYPTDVPILFAVDTGFNGLQPAYIRAAAAACIPYPAGIYGGTMILAATLGDWALGWVPISAYAWSGAKSVADARAKAIAIGAHCLQYKSFFLDGIWAIDPNVATQDFPAWGLSQPVPPQGEDMATVVTNSQDHVFDGVTYPPGAVKWALLDTQEIVHLGVGHLAYGSPAGMALDNDQLATLPYYQKPSGGGVAKGHFQGTIDGQVTA